ncbi:MAG: hypothetical protein F8N39_00500 [Clostridiaceae bacterium]|nr:hypothetical protein [Clostridiaceae bacterium]
MIYFPAPYEDEILYSVLARYAILNDSISHEAILKEIYGKNIISSNIDLPFAIKRLVSNLPILSNITEELIIDKHTLFSFYTTFLHNENVDFIYNSMLGDNGSQIYIKSGQATSTIKKNQHLRFCPQCFKEDMQKHGESYWRRQHQIPGIIVCGKHKCFLQDSRVSNGEDIKRKFVTANEESCIEDKDCFEKFIEANSNDYKNIETRALREEILNKLLLLCNHVDFLLTHNNKPQNMSFFINKYIDALGERGLTNSAGFTYPDKIQKQFYDYHGDAFLKITQSLNDMNDPCNWLYLFLRKNKSIRHPIRHLLFSMFLEIEMEDLLDYKNEGQGRRVSKMNYEPRRKKEDVRAKWIKLMKDNPEATRGELQAIDKGSHIWLLRYDKQWYEEVSPKRKKMKVPKDKKDWDVIDKEALVIVEEALKTILKGDEKPVRITKGYLLRFISDKVRIHSLNRHPLTKQIIELSVESLEKFRDRKMKWAIKSLLEDNEEITMWKVIRKMGIGSNITDKLKNSVILYINNLLDGNN